MSSRRALRRAGRVSPRAGSRRGRRALVLAAAGGPAPEPEHIFDTLGATWWIDAAEETTGGATSACQWALNRGNQAVPHARLGSTGRAELRGSYGLVLPGVSGNYASAPDSAALSITGDIDIQARIAPTDWTPSTQGLVAGKWGSTTGNQAYGLFLDTSGTLRFVQYSGAAYNDLPSTVATGFTDGEAKWVRATYSASGGTVKFYTAPDASAVPSSWTQLGTTVAGVARTTQNTANTLTLGESTTSGSNLLVGAVYRVRILDGYDGAGSVVFDADFTAPAAFATSFTESSSNAATVTITATSGADTNDPLLLTHTGTNYLYIPDTGNADYASIPAAASGPLDITGDIDLIAKVALDDWTPTNQKAIITRGTASGTAAWRLYVNNTGYLQISWVDSGAAAQSLISDAAPSVANGAVKWIRGTLDLDNGAGDCVARFYTSDDGSSWTQLGTDRTLGATSTMRTGTAGQVRLGSYWSGTNQCIGGKLYRAIIKSGIDGTIALDADFTANTNQSSFTESSSNAATVTINRATSGRKAVMVTRPVWLFGTDDYMEVADNAPLDISAADSLTVVMIRRQWGTTPSYGTLVSKTAGGTADGWSLFNNISATSHSFSIADGAAQTYLTGAGCPAYTYGALELAAGVRNVGADTITAYVGTTGGTPATDTTTSDLSSSDPMRIGRAAAGATPYYGEYEVVAVAVFRSALDSTALASIASYFGV